MTIELTARGAETELRLRHEGFPTEDARQGHAQGWASALVRLGAALDS